MTRIVASGFLGAFLAIAAVVLMMAGAAEASPRAVAQASSNPFAALVGERRERRVDQAEDQGVDRYVLATDDRAFLIQARARTARVKFLCAADDPRLDCTLDPTSAAPEIYLLTVTRGPRGDLIFKDADGETYLRLASYGGATVFWPGDSQGHAASKSFGDDRSIELQAVDREAIYRRAAAASASISALAGAPVVFDALPQSGAAAFGNAVLGDAIMRATNGLRAVAADPTGARILAERISRIIFVAANAPGMSIEDKTFTIQYVPDQDIAGRPSSRAVERFLENSLQKLLAVRPQKRPKLLL